MLYREKYWKVLQIEKRIGIPNYDNQCETAWKLSAWNSMMNLMAIINVRKLKFFQKVLIIQFTVKSANESQ